MKNLDKVVSVLLIVGFLFVDFLFFHDIFKAGETTTWAQYLTGALSLLVFAVSAKTLLDQKAKLQ